MASATNPDTPATIDDYIAGFPPELQARLQLIRTIARRVAPQAAEGISYRMPALRQRGVLVWFAAFKRHIGLYPPVAGDAALLRDLAPYAGPKGNLQFPHDQPLPEALIERVVRQRLAEDAAPRRKPGAA